MQNRTYRFSTFERFFGAFFFLMFSAYFVFMGVDAWNLFSIQDQWAIGEISFGNILGALFVSGLSLVVILLWCGMAIYALTYQISLSDTGIQVQARKHWGWKLLHRLNGSYFTGEIQFNTIWKIEVAGWAKPGHAEVYLRDGKRIFLGFRVLENNTEFMKQLASHLSPDQFGAGTDFLGKPRRFKTLVWVIYTIVLISLSAGYLHDPFINIWKSTIWNEELSALATYGISSDRDGSIWVSTGAYRDDAYIWHLSTDGRQHWKFPANLCDRCLLHSVSHTSEGYPVVLDTGSERSTIFKWDGQQWAEKRVEINFFSRNVNSYETRVWGEQNGQIVYWDFSTDKMGNVPFPPDVIEQDMQIFDYKVIDDSVLVYFFERDVSETIYKLSNGQWSEAAYSNPVGDTAMAYGLDDHGTIWAVKSIDSEKRQILLGYFDTDSETWIWQDIGQFFNYPLAFFKDVAVDSLGRVWIAGVYEGIDEETRFLEFVKVVSWSDDVSEVVEYNENNSNFENISSLTVTSDGRIWASDLNLLWLDATTEQLPAPLPDWVAKLDIYKYLGFYVAVFLVQMCLLIFAGYLDQK
ncbi:MAG: hypothetical protein U0V48_04030 [Anaerolineales bacterium]